MTQTQPSPPAGMRLAQLGEPGANLYNSFHLLTQIAGLYAQAQTLEHHAVLKVILADLADGAIQDLGDLYAAWDALVSAQQKMADGVDDVAFGQRIVRACLRLERVNRALNVWVPITKLTAVIGLAEKKWQTFAEEGAKREPILAEKLLQLKSQSEGRHSRLGGLIERLKREYDMIAEVDRVEREIVAQGT